MNTNQIKNRLSNLEDKFGIHEDRITKIVHEIWEPIVYRDANGEICHAGGKPTGETIERVVSK